MVALIGLVAHSPVSSAVEPPVRQVLVLQSFARGNLVLDHFTTNLRVDLDQLVGGPVNYIQVNVGPTGFVGAPEQSIVDFIRSTYADRSKPDLILTIAGPAAVFARKYRQQLFPESPLLLASIGIHSPEALLLRQIASQRTGSIIAQEGPVQSDLFPILEYAAPEAFYIGERAKLIENYDERTKMAAFAPAAKRAILRDLPPERESARDGRVVDHQPAEGHLTAEGSVAVAPFADRHR